MGSFLSEDQPGAGRPRGQVVQAGCLGQPGAVSDPPVSVDGRVLLRPPLLVGRGRGLGEHVDSRPHGGGDRESEGEAHPGGPTRGVETMRGAGGIGPNQRSRTGWITPGRGRCGSGMSPRSMGKIGVRMPQSLHRRIMGAAPLVDATGSGSGVISANRLITAALDTKPTELERDHHHSRPFHDSQRHLPEGRLPARRTIRSPRPPTAARKASGGIGESPCGCHHRTVAVPGDAHALAPALPAEAADGPTTASPRGQERCGRATGPGRQAGGG